jgi:cell wall-associated NlpC family hydrolase
MALISMLPADGQERREAASYRSPYSVRFSYPLKELLGDFERGERGAVRHQSNVPFRDWYSAQTRRRYGPWGPPAHHYPAAKHAEGRSVEWHRERVVAVGLRFAGYEYQHHHVPDWDPPRGWPWKEVRAGHNGKGVDCSNFSSFVYNQALGLKPNSAVHRQAELKEVPGPGEGRVTKVERVELPRGYAERVKALKTGDLLFIRNRKEEIAHVVLWVGPIGKSPDGTPLVLDSHGEGVLDADGVSIPSGVQLRPYREKSWYNNSAAHALRLLHGR